MVFRFTELPELAIDTVMKMFDQSEMLELSFTSEKWRNVVSKYTRRTKFDHHCLIDFSIDHKFYKITSHTKPTFSWEFPWDKVESPFEIRKSEIRKISKTEKIEASKAVDCEDTDFRTYENSLRQVLRMLKYYEDVLNCRVHTFDVGVLHTDLTGFWSVKSLQTPNTFHSGRGRVAPEVMTKILDLFVPKVTHGHIGVYPGWNYNYGKPMSGRYIFIEAAQWMSRKQLFMMDFPKIHLMNAVFTNCDYRAIIKHWMESDNKRFEYLNVIYRGPDMTDIFRLLDQKKITVGLETTEGKEKSYCPVMFDGVMGNGSIFEKGIDFRRKDGMLATFMVDKSNLHIDDRNVSHNVYFVAWHKNPHV